MYRKVYSIKLARFLCQQGFKIIETRPNPKKPWLNCFLFPQSEELNEAIARGVKFLKENTPCS